MSTKLTTLTIILDKRLTMKSTLVKKPRGSPVSPVFTAVVHYILQQVKTVTFPTSIQYVVYQSYRGGGDPECITYHLRTVPPSLCSRCYISAGVVVDFLTLAQALPLPPEHSKPCVSVVSVILITICQSLFCHGSPSSVKLLRYCSLILPSNVRSENPLLTRRHLSSFMQQAVLSMLMQQYTAISGLDLVRLPSILVEHSLTSLAF